MDENLSTTGTVEDTTPATENVEGAAPAADPAPAENPAPEQSEDTTPATEPAAEDPQTPDEKFLPVDFRHGTQRTGEQRFLNRADAKKYAQLGLLREAEQPMMDDLALMAAARGQKPAEFIQSLKDAEAAQLMEDKLTITGGDREAAEILVAAEMEKRRAALGLRAKEEAEAEQKAEQATLDRLAGELVELAARVPEMADWDNVPKAVIDDAVENNRNLTDAYLRYAYDEAKKIEQSRADAAKAAAASAGSQADSPGANVDPAIEAMCKAIRDA